VPRSEAPPWYYVIEMAAGRRSWRKTSPRLDVPCTRRAKTVARRADAPSSPRRWKHGVKESKASIANKLARATLAAIGKDRVVLNEI
jgi:hypothetical protein